MKDYKEIADTFIKFFSILGQKIASSVIINERYGKTQEFWK